MLNLSSIGPRSAAVAAAFFIASASIHPLAAQPASPASQPSDQSPMAVASGINLRPSILYQRRDIDGAASLYTPDPAYVELMPILEVLRGRDQFKGHFEE